LKDEEVVRDAMSTVSLAMRTFAAGKIDRATCRRLSVDALTAARMDNTAKEIDSMIDAYAPEKLK
jgi:hypothetical protein